MMRSRLIAFAVALLLAALLSLLMGQSASVPVYPVTSDAAPSGACQTWGLVEIVDRGADRGKIYVCQAGTWTLSPTPYDWTAQESDGTPTLLTATVIKINQATGLDMTSDGTNTVTIEGTDAVADGTTRGVPRFAAADFNADGSGRISIDYATGQESDGTLDGFVGAAAWTGFKVGRVSTDSHTGVAVYSDATAATHDTGTLVCATQSQHTTCVTTYLPDGTNAACSNDYNTGSGTPFYAVCR